MIVVLGGGLAGLSAGYTLSRAGCRTTVLEKDETVGGLARTIRHGRFRFDLGGHRFLTYNKKIEHLVVELLGSDLLRVPRKSRIYLRGRYVDYPLNPANALLKLGLPTTMAILRDYAKERVARLAAPGKMESLEDWVVAHFGRTMFNLYFKEYSEKVWGLDCSRISMDWVAQRIDGLSLVKAIKYALFRFSGREIKTLTDDFLYPRLGIGQLAERLRIEIEQQNRVRTAAEVEHVFHDHGRVFSIQFKMRGSSSRIDARECLSSIPLTILLRKLTPEPPAHVLEAAGKISFRSLVLVTLFLNRRKVTDLTWMYLPEKHIPFGRIHEPANWSPGMAPAGKTHLVAEYFCNTDDAIWQATDHRLTELTATHLKQVGFVDHGDVSGSCVLRIPYAYPVFDTHYQKHLRIIRDYLDTFQNLHVIGRSGMFSYLNMDHAMESGMQTAENILQRPGATIHYPEDMAALPCRI